MKVMAALRTRRSLAMRRRQLDRQVKPFVAHPPVKPVGGWIAAIRGCLGMTRTQLARSIGIKQPSLLELERAEASGQISLDRLERAAKALDCHVVYAVVPNSGTFEEMIDARAEEVARSIVARTANTMALESQNIDAEEQRARVAEVKDEVVRSPRILWNDIR